MLKSCQYCNSIHDVTYVCPSKPVRQYKANQYSKANGEIKRFRSSSVWQNKRNSIKERDLHICQVCIRLLYSWCTLQYNYVDTSVHHIYKLSEHWDKRLDNRCLITLCSCCHTAADLGQIPIDILLDIVRKQEDKLT